MSERFLICFDWDGTIADSMDLCVRQIELALERMGLPARTLQEMRACNGPTYRQSVDVLHIPPELGDEFLRQRMAAEMEVISTTQKLFPGVAEMLRRLKAHADLAIVSNGLPEYLKESMKMTGVDALFDRVEPFREGRTKPEALAEVLAAYGHPRSVMVGDRLGDLLAGRENHIPTVAVSYGYGHQEEWDQADFTVPTVEELETLLMNMITCG